jgi:preprotein translocase subunit SecD
MAVDANVLIFARMKEELRTGRTLANSVEAGFDHAWPSIRDSNISSMITCVILYWFGRYTGASIITGFALTLFVGVAVSMFTAIIVTRTFLRVMIVAGLGHHGWWFGIYEHPEIAAAGD